HLHQQSNGTATAWARRLRPGGRCPDFAGTQSGLVHVENEFAEVLSMTFEGGCYCGKIRYMSEGDPMLKAQCHCRECQYISGGGPNMFMLMPVDGFSYTKGTPKPFTRNDLEGAGTRDFCAEFGSHRLTRRPGLPAMILKIGTLDEPTLYGGPTIAIYTCDKQSYHAIPDGMRSEEHTSELQSH